MKTIAELASESGVHRTTLSKWVRKVRKTNPDARFIRRSGTIFLIDEESEEYKMWFAGNGKGRPRNS